MKWIEVTLRDGRLAMVDIEAAVTIRPTSKGDVAWYGEEMPGGQPPAAEIVYRTGLVVSCQTSFEEICERAGIS